MARERNTLPERKPPPPCQALRASRQGRPRGAARRLLARIRSVSDPTQALSGVPDQARPITLIVM